MKLSTLFAGVAALAISVAPVYAAHPTAAQLLGYSLNPDCSHSGFSTSCVATDNLKVKVPDQPGYSKSQGQIGAKTDAGCPVFYSGPGCIVFHSSYEATSYSGFNPPTTKEVDGCKKTTTGVQYNGGSPVNTNNYDLVNNTTTTAGAC